MDKLSGVRERRVILVPGVPLEAQIDQEGHIQAVFQGKGADGAGVTGYISFSADLYAVSKIERTKIREKIAETSGVRPSYRKDSENGTYRPLIVMTDKGGAITFAVGESSAVTLPVRLQIDETVELYLIPQAAPEPGEGVEEEEEEDEDLDGEEEAIDIEGGQQ